MTREEIEAFLAVSRYGSLSEAAEHIHISQPALGKRLTQLEEELGKKLVVRRRGIRQSELTETGRAFVRFAERFIDTMDEMRDMKERTESRKLTVASSDGPNIHILNDVFLGMKRQMPELLLRVQTRSYGDCYRHVADGRLDAALVGVNYYYRNVINIPAYSEEMVFICRRDSGYPGTVDARALDVSKCVYSPYSSEFIAWFDSWFRMQGEPFIECDLVEQTKRLLEGSGKKTWTIVPSSAAESFLEDDHFEKRKIKTEVPHRTIYLIKNIEYQTEEEELFEKLLAASLKGRKGIKSLL